MKQTHRRGLRLLAPAALLLAGLVWLENFTLDATLLFSSGTRVPQGFSGLRIAQISDLHGRSFDRDSAYLLSRVRLAQPDLIAITGDLADEYTDFSMLPPLLEGLRAIAPVYYVTGNHEWGLGAPRRQALFSLLERCGVRRLSNEYTVLIRGEDRLVLAGVDDPNGPYDQKTPAALVREIRQAQGEEVYILMLAHRNDQLSLWAKLGVDTVLSGHAHGGIVRLPFVGALFGVHYNLFPKDAAGLYQSGRTNLFVSRGLGGSRKLPIRIGNRPELLIVQLRRVPEAE